MGESLKQIGVTGLVLIMLVTLYLSVGTVNEDGQADTEEAVLLRRDSRLSWTWPWPVPSLVSLLGLGSVGVLP